MSKTTIDLTRFNSGMAAYSDLLGIPMAKVLRKECGELDKTLIRLTPPRDPAKLRAKIKGQVESKMDAINFDTFAGEKMGKGDIKWYAASPHYLFGIAADKDMTKAGTEELRQVYLSILYIKGRARQIEPIKGHPTQRAAILQNVLTTKGQRAELVKKLQSHVGRLKAGWLVSYDRLSPGGGNQPPGWVTRHRAGARGYFIDQSRGTKQPSITLANTAVGSGSAAMLGIARAAVGLRVRAMKTNLRLLLSGHKHLGDYARA